MTNRSKRIIFVASLLTLLGILTALVIVLCLPNVTSPFDVSSEELFPDRSEVITEDLSARFLSIEGEVSDWFTVPALNRLREHFKSVYPLLIETFNGGRAVRIRYRLSQADEERVAFVCEDDHKSGVTIAINPRYFKKDAKDFSLLSRELVRALLSGADVKYGGEWVLDGVCEYGLYLCEREAYTFLPFSEEQSYDSAKEVTARFFLWLNENHEATFTDQLIEGLRCEEYTPKLFVKITGYTVEELWDFYAASFCDD